MTGDAIPPKAVLFQRRPPPVRLRNNRQGSNFVSDKADMRINWAGQRVETPPSIPWALEMKAVSRVEPSRLVKTLTGGILGCGGWVLSRGASDSGIVNLLFEFERQACLDIYSVLIAAGLELSQTGHVSFTELCQCTRNRQQECGTEIASVDLEIQTLPPALLPRGTAQPPA
jgi:hypothetical protein